MASIKEPKRRRDLGLEQNREPEHQKVRVQVAHNLITAASLTGRGVGLQDAQAGPPSPGYFPRANSVPDWSASRILMFLMTVNVVGGGVCELPHLQIAHWLFTLVPRRVSR